MRRVLQVFFKQGVGLRNGRQGVSDFMRYSGRHAAHGGHFFNSHPGLHITQVFKKHHTHRLVTVAKRCCQPSTHVQVTHMLADMIQDYIGLLRQLVDERLAHDFYQRLPCRLSRQYEGCDSRHVAGRQQAARCRVGGPHDTVGVDHQHAVRECFNHEFIDLGLHACHQLAAFGQLLFARQSQG